MTEAALMLNEPYAEPPHTEEYINGLLRRLKKMFNGRIVLTGVSFDINQLGAACFDGTGEPVYAMQARIPGFFHGTGDIFGSTLISGLMNGLSLHDSAQAAADFTVASIRLTEPGLDRRYGVRFEAALSGLASRFQLS
jgi:pyridoxine kinase